MFCNKTIIKVTMLTPNVNDFICLLVIQMASRICKYYLMMLTSWFSANKIRMRQLVIQPTVWACNNNQALFTLSLLFTHSRHKFTFAPLNYKLPKHGFTFISSPTSDYVLCGHCNMMKIFLHIHAFNKKKLQLHLCVCYFHTIKKINNKG